MLRSHHWSEGCPAPHDSPSLGTGLQTGLGLNGEGKASVLQLPFSLIPMFDCL